MYIQKGKNIILETGVASHLDSLPPNHYLLRVDSDTGRYYLSETCLTKPTGRIYGDLGNYAAHYIADFEKSNKDVGVWLYGQKGMGKSLLASLVIANAGLPVVVISEPHTGDGFKEAMSGIKDECIVLLNEFDKVYKDAQDEFLTLMDGQFGGKKLYLIITNSDTINEFMVNRPGRVKFSKAFYNVPDEVVNQILDSEGISEEHDAEIWEIIGLLGTVTFDILLGIIDQMKNHNLTPKEAVRFLNIRIEHNTFNVIAYIDGRKINATLTYNPITTGRISFGYEYKDNQTGRNKWGYYDKDTKELTISIRDKRVVYADKQSNEVRLIPLSNERNYMPI